MHRNLILFILITISFIASCDEGFDLNTGITLSEQNELYSLELNVSNNVTDDFSPVHFNAKVKRHAEYNITSDSRILGSWTLHSLTIDDTITINVAQFPTDYLFYADQTFDKTEFNTDLDGEDLYSNGIWSVVSNSDGTLTLTLKMMDVSTITVTFDHIGFFVPMDGFMVWDYDKDGDNYHQILKKTSPPDPVYISVSSTGGTIEGFTVPSESDYGIYDIEVTLSNDINSNYVVSGSFLPGIDFSKGNILATLFVAKSSASCEDSYYLTKESCEAAEWIWNLPQTNNYYSVINVNIPISIEIIY
jgi:hypothetical protein